VTEVFAKEMTIDYSALLGTDPYETTGEAVAKKFQDHIAHMDST
jgi:hypothetical protein